MPEIHPDITHPTSVTHFLCPKGPTSEGRPVTTHHLVSYRTSRSKSGFAITHQVCMYCLKTAIELREETGLT